MLDHLLEAVTRWSLPGYLVPPLLASLWIAWGDLRTRRIPNYLTFSAALLGLAVQAWSGGWMGVGQALAGMALGVALLIIPHIMGGMGAGDVKALGALGAWLGPGLTFTLFLYTTLWAGFLALMVLLVKGVVWGKIRREYALVRGWLRYGPLAPTPAPVPKVGAIPYGTALALGMLVLVVRIA